MSAHLLLVEDDPDLREVLAATLRRAQWAVTAVETAEAGLATLEAQGADLVISDIRLPGMDGMALLERVRMGSGHPPVVLMTAHADAMLAVAALKAGARDLLLKPFDAERLLEAARRHVPPAQAEQTQRGLLAHDPAMQAVVKRVERAARVDASVLLTGESGVGKEVMARHIHLTSPRAHRPFVAIHCAAIPDALLEATLFGHEKGSFTGASRQQVGKFEQAQGGTLFLDEIGELPLETQVKLLRVLQERSVERLGGRQQIAVDIRIIAATNRDLARDVASGRFREDLYYRIAVFPVKIPALRERPADIPPLAANFVSRYAASFGLPDARLSAAAVDALRAHRWPGNVRELENTIQRALLLTDSALIEPDHLELSKPDLPTEPAAPTCQEPAQTAAQVASAAGAPPPAAELTQDRQAVRPSPPVRAVPRNVRDVEREHILAVLDQVQGNRREAIAILGISERALRYKLKAFRSADSGLAGPTNPTTSTDANRTTA